MMNAIKITHAGTVARVTLNRPDARNALDGRMCDTLRNAFPTLAADPAIRVVLVDAIGPVFCAGADLKERHGRDEAWVRQRRLAGNAAYAAIEACGKPVIAIAQGPLIGAGAELALACDFIVASTAASFRFPELQWGSVGATQRLQRAIGKRRAKELLFTGRSMPAEEAYGLGLIARLTAPDTLQAVADEVAAAIAKAPPLAIQLTKQSIDLGDETTLHNGLRIEFAAIERVLADGGWRGAVEGFGAAAASHGDAP
jgi:enoyl-CoA hydratase/carnithine racemase